jgi:Putative peptidoglycan binding domain
MAAAVVPDESSSGRQGEHGVSSVNVGLPYLRIGSGGQLLWSIQEQLQRSDFFTGGIDDIFGQQTAQAVWAFQRGHGLNADGTVGPDTWMAPVEAGLDPAVEAADLDNGAPEVNEIKERSNEEYVSTSADARPALDRAHERAAQEAPLTAQREAAILNMGRKEFALHLSDDDPEVRRLLRQLADELPPDLREIKRVINAYRCYAHIRYRREDAGLPAPTLDGVAKLALLAVRYLHLLSLLGEGVAQDSDGKSLLSWLEPAHDDADWKRWAKLALRRLRAEFGKYGRATGDASASRRVSRIWIPVAAGLGGLWCPASTSAYRAVGRSICRLDRIIISAVDTLARAGE